MSDDILSQPPPPFDLRATYGSDPNQFIELRVPKTGKSPYPCVLNIHGGFWRAKYNLDHAGHLCAALSARGIATANVEYRRVGDPGGAWPGTFDDIRTAYRFLQQGAKKYGLAPGQFVVMGHSAGGQLALCLAAHESSVTRVVSLAGVCDLQRAYQLHLSNDAVVEFMRGTPSEVPDHYREADPMKVSVTAEQWLIHGTADDIVPVDFSRAYVAAKQGLSVEQGKRVHLLAIHDAGHFDLIDPHSKAWTQVEQAILRSLDTGA